MKRAENGVKAHVIAEDKLRGAAAIAAFIGENERRTYYLLERKLLPAGKEGQVYIASKRRLRLHFERLTAGVAE